MVINSIALEACIIRKLFGSYYLELSAVGKRNAVTQISLCAKFIDAPYYLTGISPQLVVMSFEFVEFFDDCHRQHYDIVFEALDGFCIVKENIGIEDKDFLHYAVSCLSIPFKFLTVQIINFTDTIKKKILILFRPVTSQERR